MGLIHDNREPRQDSNVPREPLVDVSSAGEPPQTNGNRAQERMPNPESQPKSQRRSLSDVQGTSNEPPVSDRAPRMPSSGHRRLEIPDVESNGGLIDLDALPEEPAQPVRPAQPQPMAMPALPEEPRPQPRAARPRPTEAEPVAEEQPSRPVPSRPRLTNDEPLAEEQAYRPKPSRPRVAVAAPQVDEVEPRANGRPRLAETQPIVEEPELPPPPSRPQPASSQPLADVPEAPTKAHRPRLGQDGRISGGSSGTAQPRSPADQARLEQLIAQVRVRQNLTLAMVIVLTVAAVGALTWIVFTTLTSHSIV